MSRRGRQRMRPWKIGLDPRTRANLDRKARAHGVSRPAYVRSLINGERPGAEPGTTVALADSWWDSRTPARRVSIFRNHANAPEKAKPDDQLSIDDIELPEVTP